MQNFDVLLPTSHTSSSRNAEANLNPKKPPQGGEKFDDVMDRALTGSVPESNGDDQASDKVGKQTADSSSSANQSKHASKSKKTHRRELVVKDDAATAQLAVANSISIFSPPVPNQIVLGDQGSSENESETGTHEGKQVTTVGTVTDASQLIAAQLLALSGTPPPISAPTASTGNTVLKEVKGISSSTLSLPAKPEVSTSTPNLTAVSKQDAKLVKPNSDSKTLEIKSSADPVDHSGNAPEKGGITLPHDFVLHATEPHSDKTELTQVQVNTAADPQDTQSAQPKAPVTNVSTFASGLDGTSAAKQDMTMKKADKMTKVAGPAEQDLPGNATTDSEELLTGQKLSTKASSHGSDKAESTASAETPTAPRISTSIESAAPTITTAAVAPAAETDSRVRVLERTHDIVALHAMRLSETGSDSLHVVVKPGDGIQISLELRKSQDGIEVHASLHKGDFDHLRQYWPELQQRLESRGVRVGTLTTSENFSSTSQQQFQQSKQQQSSDQDPMYAGAFAEFALAGSMSEAPATRAARATAYRGWETWA